MCELFGATSAQPIVVNDLLRTFFSHSPSHPNGWGLACMQGSAINIEKEPLQATKSHYLRARLTQEVQGQAIFAHIRYATIGNQEFSNCHPFSKLDITGRRWTLIHNGTIFDYPPTEGYIHTQRGDTDSERVLLCLVDRVNEASARAGAPLGRADRFRLMDSLFCDLAKGNKLNLLLFDGELMYVHTNYKDSLHLRHRAHETIFSTQPLEPEGWQKVPFTRLLAYHRGDLAFTGTCHGQEFIDNEENTQLLYRIFAGL